MLQPLLRFIYEVRELRGNDEITVVLPWLVPTRWWQKLLHNRIPAALRDELNSHRGIVVTAVPYHLQEPNQRSLDEV